MTKKNKIRFVENLTGSIKSKIISKIESGKIPDSWNGFELRQLLADKFTSESWLMPNKKMKRRRDYENTVIINNI